MADWAAEDGELRAWLSLQIDSCDALIHIPGVAYGAEPVNLAPATQVLPAETPRCSYTQYQFLYAQQRSLKTWVIAPGPGCTRDTPLDQLDLDPSLPLAEARQRQHALRQLQQQWLQRLKDQGHVRHQLQDDHALSTLLQKLNDHASELHQRFSQWPSFITCGLQRIEDKQDRTEQGDQELATQVNAGNGQIARMPVWLSLAAKNLNSATPATAQLKSLLFVEPGSVSVETRQGREITPLIESSATAGTVPASTLQFSGPDEVSRTLVAGTAKKNLAVLIRGPFTSAFPKGAPKADSAADKPADPAKPAASSLKSGSGTLVVIADTDWLLDDFSVRRQAIFGQEMVEPLNDNLFFGSNLIDCLAGSPDLIALRGKRSAQRPFEVVARMEADAQKQFNSKLAALETRIASVQSKLAELQRKSPDGGRLVATPEVLKTIEEFQAQELSMRRERRDIRRSLRVGIDALETKLLVINLLASPVLLGFFGVWFTRHRRHAA
jgi:hypothetical protein